MSEHSSELITNFVITAIVLLAFFFGAIVVLYWKISLTAPAKRPRKEKPKHEHREHRPRPPKEAQPQQEAIPVQINQLVEAAGAASSQPNESAPTPLEPLPSQSGQSDVKPLAQPAAPPAKNQSSSGESYSGESSSGDSRFETVQTMEARTYDYSSHYSYSESGD
jgi:hypothetical protein